MINKKIFRKIRENKIIFFSIIFGVISVITYALWYLSLKIRIDSYLPYPKGLCVLDTFYILHELPYYLFLKFVPYIKLHMSFNSTTILSSIVYSLSIIIFYLLLGFILNKAYKKNKLLFKTILVLLAIILIILIMISFYMSCIFTIGVA